MRHNICGCGCHHYTPIVVILFALLFLVRAMGYVPEPMVAVVWPILVGVIGIIKLSEHQCDCR